MNDIGYVMAINDNSSAESTDDLLVNAATDEDAAPPGRYGFGSWSPDALQRLNNALSFLAFLCVSTLGQSMTVNILIGVTISSV